jgi:hypothetical protein
MLGVESRSPVTRLKRIGPNRVASYGCLATGHPLSESLVAPIAKERRKFKMNKG